MGSPTLFLSLNALIVNRVFVLLLIFAPRNFLDCNMDSGEIVYAVVEEVIGKTGKLLRRNTP